VFDPTKPKPTGEAAYRFIIDISEVANNPDCLPIDAKDGCHAKTLVARALSLLSAAQRSLSIYNLLALYF
jgi:hypothetical protein